MDSSMATQETVTTLQPTSNLHSNHHSLASQSLTLTATTTSSPQSLRFISDSFIKPQYLPQASNRPLFLPPCDLAFLSVHYIQGGLLFTEPPRFDIQTFLHKLEYSLSSTLIHFYPLVGRLATLKRDCDNPPFYTVYVDCVNSPGARFIHATLDATVSDILSPTYVPSVVSSFFDHDQAINHDGHTMSLLSVQVTELRDGIFIGLSMNHSIGDGTSFWHFFNAWSEMFQAQQKSDNDNNIVKLSQPPVLERWFPENHPGPINLPYTDPSEFIARFQDPELLRVRIFHFSSDFISMLKAKANRQCNTTKISTLQSLTAFVWRCITRVRGLPPDNITICLMPANNRHRLSPPLSSHYFGNSTITLCTVTTVGELVGNDIGWVAWLLHKMVAELTDEKIRKWHEEWIESPKFHKWVKTNLSAINMTSSPWFDKYGNEFGLGKAVAVRNGYANKYDGTVYAGSGGRSVGLEISLPPETMAALESDQEFTAAARI